MFLVLIMKMNHFKILVFFLLLPNLMVFSKLFIWNRIIFFIRSCLNKHGENNIEIGSLKDFILRVVLNQVYIPYLGMKCLLNPGDNDQRVIHWDQKVMFAYFSTKMYKKSVGI